MKPISITLFGIAGLVSLVLGLAGCSTERAIAPRQTGPADNIVFATAKLQYTDQTLISYSLADKSFDTVAFASPLAKVIHQNVATREIYIGSEQAVHIYSMDSIIELARIPVEEWFVRLSVSPDGQYFVVLSSGGPMKIYRRADLTIVYSDSSEILWYDCEGGWSQDSRRYYGGVALSNDPIRQEQYAIVDVNAGLQLLGGRGEYVGALVMKPSPDENLIYTIEATYLRELFNVYDVIGDSMMFSYRVQDYPTDLAVSPLGDAVYFVGGMETYASPYIFVYDVALNTISHTINIDALVTEPKPYEITLDRLWLSSDGNRLVAGSDLYTGWFVDYDLASHQLQTAVSVPGLRLAQKD